LWKVNHGFRERGYWREGGKYFEGGECACSPTIPPRQAAAHACVNADTKATRAPSDVLQQSEIEEIETQYQDPVLVYQKEQTLKACLAKCTACSTFEDGLQLLGEKFTLLRHLAGGISTVFPSTAAVESDFTRIEWEKKEFRSALTDFSLEGILH
jgi:hypothetical protein